MKNKILAANWKMAVNKTLGNSLTEMAIKYAKTLATKNSSHKICLSPTSLFISEVASQVKASGSNNLKVGAQNVFWENSGAYTGECSVEMLKSCGASYAIVGHSERRSLFGETDAQCARRAIGAMKQGLEVFYCIGESLEERKSGTTKEVISKQLEVLFNEEKNNDCDLSTLLTIAYEPVWAIGTGLSATCEEIKDAHEYINSLCEAQKISPAILYGGSISPKNWLEILNIPHVSGGLIGGSSQKLESFDELLKILSEN